MSTFKRLLSRAIVNTPTTVGAYTAPTATTVIGLTIANTYTTTIKVTVTLFDGVNSTHIVKDADVPQGGSLVVVGGDQKVVLQTGDAIQVNTDAAINTCDVVMSVLEV